MLVAVHHLYRDRSDPPATSDAVAAALQWARIPVAGASGLLEYIPHWGDRVFDYIIGHGSRVDAAPVTRAQWPVLQQFWGKLAYRGRHRSGQCVEEDLFAVRGGQRVQLGQLGSETGVPGRRGAGEERFRGRAERAERPSRTARISAPSRRRPLRSPLAVLLGCDGGEIAKLGEPRVQEVSQHVHAQRQLAVAAGP